MEDLINGDTSVAVGLAIVVVREIFSYLKNQKNNAESRILDKIDSQLDRVEKIIEKRENEIQQLKDDFTTAKIYLARLLERE